MNKLLKDLFTDPSNVFDLKRMQWFVGTIVYFGLGISHEILHGNVDLAAFAVGLATIFGAAAWGINAGDRAVFAGQPDNSPGQERAPSCG